MNAKKIALFGTSAVVLGGVLVYALGIFPPASGRDGRGAIGQRNVYHAEQPADATVNPGDAPVANDAATGPVKTSGLQNGQMNQLKDGQVVALQNGMMVRMKNGELVALQSGQLNQLQSGQVFVQMKNGQLLALQSGQLNQMKNGQVVALQNGMMMQLQSGSMRVRF